MPGSLEGNSFIAQSLHETRGAAQHIGSRLSPEVANRYSELSRIKPKDLTPEQREQFNQDQNTLFTLWFSKIEKQFSNKQGFNRFFFERWEHIFSQQDKNKTILTQQLTDREYERISADRAIQDQPTVSKEETLRLRRIEQMNQLEQWFSYLLTGDGAEHHLEKWFRYYVLYNVATRDKNGQSRKPDTTMHFVDLNQGALAQVYDELMQLTSGPQEDKSRQQKLEAFQQYNFHQRYNYFIAESEKQRQENGKWEDGWVTFTDAEELTRASAGTPWCLSGLYTASSYLQDNGKVHVFFQNGHPQIGIAERDGAVREVRGSDDSQNLSPKYVPDLEKKLEEFPNGHIWHQQAEDMRIIAALEVKIHEDVQLTQEDLRQLYEIEKPLVGFGYQSTKRIQQLRSIRNSFSDAAIIFGCEQAQIAQDINKIDKSTRIYIGPLEPNFFQKLKDYPDIKEIYISFPEKKIDRIRLQIDKPTPFDKLKDKLNIAGIKVTDAASSMIYKTRLKVSKDPRIFDLVSLRAQDLGLTRNTTLNEIYERAEKLKLTICPPEAVPYACLTYAHQPIGAGFYVAMDEISTPYGSLNVFRLFQDEHSLWLTNALMDRNSYRAPKDKFLFYISNS